MVLERPRGMRLLQWITLFSVLLGIKFIWKHHVGFYGFQSFSQGISVQAALAALNPFNAHYHFVQHLYIRKILFSNFDHLLKTPWLVMYAIITGLWCYLVKNYPQEKTRVNKIMGCFTLFTIIYLLMLYCLQAIVFGVNAGGSNVSILDFQRYYNMLFLPWVGLTFFIALDIIKPQYAGLAKRVTTVTVIVALIFLAGGKIERMKKFYQVPNLDKIYTLVNQKIPRLHNKNWALCLTNPPQPYYQTSMPLTWFYMPNRVFSPDKVSHSSCDINITWQDGNPVIV